MRAHAIQSPTRLTTKDFAFGNANQRTSQPVLVGTDMFANIKVKVRERRHPSGFLRTHPALDAPPLPRERVNAVVGCADSHVWMRWWSRTGSNRRPPECHSGALPAELRPLTHDLETRRASVAVRGARLYGQSIKYSIRFASQFLVSSSPFTVLAAIVRAKSGTEVEIESQETFGRRILGQTRVSVLHSRMRQSCDIGVFPHT